MESLDSFYNSLLVEDGLSKITVAGYKKVLTKFFREIGTLTINQENVNSYFGVITKAMDQNIIEGARPDFSRVAVTVGGT